MTPAKFLPGLVSITFRKLSPEQVIAAVAEARLSAIEWGGDVHVPHGDVAVAKRVGKMTSDAGLAVSAYGSYYRAGTGDAPEWSAVLDSASALGTTVIRVWAGKVGSEESDCETRKAVVTDLHRIAVEAEARKIVVSLEYHGNTLTDTLDSTLRLLKEVNRPNLRSAWQPRHGVATAESVAEIEAIKPHLTDLHVFHWWPDARTRRTLAQGTDRWRAFLAAARGDRPRHAMLEFVQNDDLAQFYADAKTLRAWLGEHEGD